MNQLCANTLSNFFVLFFLLCKLVSVKAKVWSRGRHDSFIGVCAAPLSSSHFRTQSRWAGNDSYGAELSSRWGSQPQGKQFFLICLQYGRKRWLHRDDGKGVNYIGECSRWNDTSQPFEHPSVCCCWSSWWTTAKCTPISGVSLLCFVDRSKHDASPVLLTKS